MFQNLVDCASHRFVASELEITSKRLFISETIENYFSVLDFKKWRIAHTIVAYKSDDS